MKQCVDPRLKNEYPPKGVAKVLSLSSKKKKQCILFSFNFLPAYRSHTLLLQLAAVAALCVQYESEFRPNMSIVVKALSPLLANKQATAPPPVPVAHPEA